MAMHTNATHNDKRNKSQKADTSINHDSTTHSFMNKDQSLESQKPEVELLRQELADILGDIDLIVELVLLARILIFFLTYLSFLM